jgi:hypothetical protein
MQLIPVVATPAQSFSIVLNGQAVQVNLYSLETPGDILAPLPGPTIDTAAITMDSGTVTIDQGPTYSTTALQGDPALYMDLIVNGQQVLNAKLAQNLIPMLLSAGYYDVQGDFVFVDTHALANPLAGTNPVYTGLGSQYQMIYLEPEDLQ